MSTLNNASTNNNVVPAAAAKQIVRPERKRLVVDTAAVISVSPDAKSQYSNSQNTFPYLKTFEAARDGDIDAALALLKELTDRLIDVSERADTAAIEALKALGDAGRFAKEPAKLRLERSYREEQVKLLGGMHDKSGHDIDGLIDEMVLLKANGMSTKLPEERWYDLKDQQIDKFVVTEPLNWHSMCRLLNGGGAQKFLKAERNVICRPVLGGFDFCYIHEGETYHVVFDGEVTHNILMKMVDQQNVPFTQLGVLPSDGLPNVDGKTGLARLDWLTGKAEDAQYYIRIFCADMVHAFMVRSLLYAYNPEMYIEFEFDNGRLRRFMGDALFIGENVTDFNYFMALVTMETNKRKAWKLKGMLGEGKYFGDISQEVAKMFVTETRVDEKTGAVSKVDVFHFEKLKETRLATLNDYYDLMEEIMAAKAEAAKAKAAKAPAASGVPQTYQKHATPALGGLSVGRPGAGAPTPLAAGGAEDEA